MQLHIVNMTCGGCARRVTKAIQALDAAARVETDPANRKVEVSTSRSRREIEAVLAEVGYPAAATPAS
jgi:copper chaperone